MTSELSFHIHVDNIIPHADKQGSQEVFSIWKAASHFFNELSYECVSANGLQILSTKIKLDLSGAVEILESALERSGSFDNYRELHSENSDTDVGAILAMTIGLNDKDARLATEDAYYIASTFQQQLFLTMNLAFPGSCKLIGTRFVGHNAHLYEAQSFDSKLFYDARMCSHQQSWPALQKLDLTSVWAWLNMQGFSRSDIAISSINKVLFNMLKLAQQRHRFGSRSALLATKQFQLLLDTQDETRLRNRTSLVLGQIPEASDCFVALLQLRRELFEGHHPVRRPALICHSSYEENREQMSSHNTTIELAATMIVALVQQLIKTEKSKFQFKESPI
jgi:hypothetical protein